MYTGRRRRALEGVERRFMGLDADADECVTGQERGKLSPSMISSMSSGQKRTSNPCHRLHE